MKRKNKIKLGIMPILVFILLSYGVAPVAASTIGTPKTVQLITSQSVVAKMGFTTEHFLSYGSDLHPQYYASSIASGCDDQGMLFFVNMLRIDVEGWDPLGNKLSPDRFTSLSILVSPQDNQATQDILEIIYASIVDLAPVGAKQTLQQTTTSGGGETGYNSNYAWGKWTRPTVGIPGMERGIRLGFQLAVDPDLEGTYKIHILTAMEVCAYDGIRVYYTGSRVLEKNLYYGYDAEPSGGGCPILSVFDGNEYVDEGLLDIHSEFDVEKGFTIHTSPVPVGNTYRMRLTEHPLTISHIDKVQLFGRLSNGKVMALPLISATHSAIGNVKQILHHSDDVRIDVLGAKFNGGTSEYIDLSFQKLGNLEFVEYIFLIEGYNVVSKF
ncbi:MAG: hypothetical protein P1Q69_15895 [Candidatus Thorarchaeota archaeon]|nr:hypothetical protein [Candidatus Thorarchaeota archaeon]